MKTQSLLFAILFFAGQIYAQSVPFTGQWEFTFSGDVEQTVVDYIFHGQIYVSLEAPLSNFKGGISHSGKICGNFGTKGVVWGEAVHPDTLVGYWFEGNLSGEWKAVRIIQIQTDALPSHPVSGCWEFHFESNTPGIGFENITLTDTLDYTGFGVIDIPNSEYKIEVVGTWYYEIFGIILDENNQVCGAISDEYSYDEEPFGDYSFCEDNTPGWTGTWEASYSGPEILITSNGTVFSEHYVEICPGDTVILTVTDVGTSYLWTTGDTTQSILVDEAGIYRVAVFHDCGSTLSHPFTVMHPDNPTIIVLPGETLACKNQPLEIGSGLFFPDCDLCYWLKDGEPIPGVWGAELSFDSLQKSDEGLYSMVVDIPDLCWFDTLDFVDLEVEEVPEISIQQNGDTLIAVLSGNGDDILTYQWYRNGQWIPGAYHPSVVVGESGDYSVKGWTFENHCETASEIFSVFISSVNDISEIRDFKVLKNPVEKSDEFPVLIESNSMTEIELNVLDITGKKLFSEIHSLNKKSNQIPVTAPDYSGLFYVQIKKDGHQISQPIIVR